VLSGEFICVNRHLIEEMIKLGLWNKVMMNEVISKNGSIQNVEGIPDNIKKRFRTVWEIPQKAVLNLAIGRAPFID
jgi:ribonucleotide reductase alpha subunit